jgi:hypothetical protein
VYAHTGWRQIDGEWIYLDAGGGIGRNGRVGRVEIEVDLPSQLGRYQLPDPPSGDVIKASILACFRLLKVAKGQVTYPLACGVARSVLSPCDFSIFVGGPTGEGKTELTARYQQHFGPQMDARHLPANWSSTGNALEALAFAAKDAMLTVDDFCPTGSAHDVQRYHREADGLLRAQGNSSGRVRMNWDTSLRPEKHPRGLIVCTGEDFPRGQSLRSRCLGLELGPGQVDWTAMSSCQKDGHDGQYAKAMAAFIQWLAPQYSDLQKHFLERVNQLRDKATSNQEAGPHRL